MQNSGEQFVPGISSPRLQEEHLARYEFAKQFCRGKNVLDIACGTGYGSHELSKIAKSVTGVDISADSVVFARDNYKKENLSFIEKDCTKIQFEKGSFDIIISFETIEHLNEKHRIAFYATLRDAVKDGGTLIFSTPNKRITSPYTEKPLNPFHVLEFSRNDLQKELDKFFVIKEWCGQRFVPRILTYKLVRKFTRFLEILFRMDFAIYSTRYPALVTKWETDSEPRVMIMVAGKK